MGGATTIQTSPFVRNHLTPLPELSWHCIMAVVDQTGDTDARNLTFVTVLLYQHCIGYYLKYILPDYKQRMCITNVLSFVSVFFGCDFTHFYHYGLKLLPTTCPARFGDMCNFAIPPHQSNEMPVRCCNSQPHCPG